MTNTQPSTAFQFDTIAEQIFNVYNRISTMRDIIVQDSECFPKLSHFGNDAVISRPSILQDEWMAEFNAIRLKLADISSLCHTTNRSQPVVENDPAVIVDEVPTGAKEPSEEMKQSAQLLMAQIQAALSGGRDVETIIGELQATGGLTVDQADTDYPEPEALTDQLQGQENNLQRLLGSTSPLLDIFAPGPWLPNGKGTVTISSIGFKWYKSTDPMDYANDTRAKLPSGFYGGEEYPKFVMLRMDTCILFWNFKMESRYMLVYIAGLSDAIPDGVVRWFEPNELSASYTRRLVTEITETAKHRNKSAA